MSSNSIGGLGGVNFGSPQDANSSVITVRLGETISDVANRVGCTKEELLQANPQIKDPYQKLNAGQELALPQSTAASSSSSVNEAAASGKPQHSEFVITKNLDQSSATFS
jgi:LysM repeat protein